MTRRASSSEVTPVTQSLRPLSRSVDIPCSTAAAKISSVGASISRRIFPSTDIAS